MAAVTLATRPAWVDESVILLPSLISEEEATQAKAEKKKLGQLESAVWNSAEETDDRGFTIGGRGRCVYAGYGGDAPPQ